MKVKVLQPEYMNSFKCIGSACEDTCCAGWNVAVDKKTFKRYKNETKGPLLAKFKNLVKRDPQSKSDLDYGSMVLSDGRCPFLSENLWCEIHSQYGEEHLAIVCDNYPRMYTKVGADFYRALNTSCPEANRVALVSEEPMSFEWVELELTPQRLIYGMFIDGGVNPLHASFETILYYSIDLLQDRQYTIEDRMVIYGMFTEALDQLVIEKKFSEVEALVQDYKQAQLRFFKEELKEKPAENPMVPLVLIKGVLDYLQLLPANSNMKKQYDGFVKGLGIDPNDNPVILSQKYEKAVEAYRKGPWKRDAVIFEHYLVNYIFRTAGVFGAQSSKDHFVTTVILFAMMRLMSVGLYADKGEDYGIEDTLLNIQLISKLVEHNKNFVSQLINEYEKKGYLDLGHMTLLLYS